MRAVTARQRATRDKVLCIFISKNICHSTCNRAQGYCSVQGTLHLVAACVSGCCCTRVTLTRYATMYRLHYKSRVNAHGTFTTHVKAIRSLPKSLVIVAVHLLHKVTFSLTAGRLGIVPFGLPWPCNAHPETLLQARAKKTYQSSKRIYHADRILLNAHLSKNQAAAA